MGSSESKQAHRQIHESSAAGVRFPNTFTLYYDASWSKLKLLIGEDPSTPLYAFNLVSGWFGDLIMHAGPSLESPPLAAARNTGKLAYGNTITLPPLGPGQEPIEAQMPASLNGLRQVYAFSVPVGRADEKKQIVKFEWVGTKGEEVNNLDEWLHGWKLRRATRDDKDKDENEVLAVWAEASMSVKRAAKFQFINSGATGELGETWALMAVISFVRIWQRYMQQVVVV